MYSSFEEAMRTNVRKGGIGAPEHFGIKQDGTIQMGADLARFDYVKRPSEYGVVSCALLLGPTEEQWSSLDVLIDLIKRIYPSIERVVAGTDTIIKDVEERYGSSTKTGAMP